MDKNILLVNAQAGPGSPVYVMGTRAGLIHLRSLIENALEDFHGGVIGLAAQADLGEYPIVVGITTHEEAVRLPRPYVLEHERGEYELALEDAHAIKSLLAGD